MDIFILSLMIAVTVASLAAFSLKGIVFAGKVENYYAVETAVTDQDGRYLGFIYSRKNADHSAYGRVYNESRSCIGHTRKYYKSGEWWLDAFNSDGKLVKSKHCGELTFNDCVLTTFSIFNHNKMISIGPPSNFLEAQ